jgi:hypothetical protein
VLHWSKSEASAGAGCEAAAGDAACHHHLAATWAVQQSADLSAYTYLSRLSVWLAGRLTACLPD